MPVMLKADSYALWVDPGEIDPGDLNVCNPRCMKRMISINPFRKR